MSSMANMVGGYDSWRVIAWRNPYKCLSEKTRHIGLTCEIIVLGDGLGGDNSSNQVDEQQAPFDLGGDGLDSVQHLADLHRQMV